MRKLFLHLIVLLFFYSQATASESHQRYENIAWASMYCLPHTEIDKHFEKVKEEVHKRWDTLTKKVEFPTFSKGRPEEALIEEFYKFNQLRLKLWLYKSSKLPCQSNASFKISQQHLLEGRFRQPSCITFEHSATDTSYNSTSLTVGKRRFFALEGPTEQHLPHFFRLLANWNVNYLVCLTDEIDCDGSPKCFPYWKDRIVDDEKNQFLRLCIEGPYELKQSAWAVKKIPYLFWPDWEDHQGVDYKKLVEAANHVRKGISENDIIAVHCSAGVGRTGTFICTICLLDSIDEQLAKGSVPDKIQLSIPKLFLYLNFHRPWLVAKPTQYITLYQAVEWYLSQQSSKKK